VFYKYGGKLVGKRIRKPLSFEITELLFADDGVIICCTRQDMEEAARVFDEVAAKFGLTVSVVKTNLLVAGSNLREEDLAPRGQLVEEVQSSSIWVPLWMPLGVWLWMYRTRLGGHLEPLGLCMAQCFVIEIIL